MLALIQPLTGGYLSVTEWGKLVVTSTYDKRSAFDLSGDGSVPTLARSVDANAFLAVTNEGSVSVTHSAPDLRGSGLEVHPGALYVGAIVSFRVRELGLWLSTSAANGQVSAVALGSPGRTETFKLWGVPIEVEQVNLQGAEEVAAGVRAPKPVAPLVGGWRHCRNCGVLFDSNGPQQACPGQHTVRTIERLGRRRPPAGHTATDATDYLLSTSGESRYSDVLFLRRCKQCSGLTPAPSPEWGSGPCASGGSSHSFAGSLLYGTVMPVDPPRSSALRWRICAKCALLFRDDGGPNVCAVGDQHDPGLSPGYDVQRAP
jgi:hypothetical protein